MPASGPIAHEIPLVKDPAIAVSQLALENQEIFIAKVIVGDRMSAGLQTHQIATPA